MVKQGASSRDQVEEKGPQNVERGTGQLWKNTGMWSERAGM